MHRGQDLMPISGSSPSWLPGAPFSYHLQPQSRFHPLTNGMFPVGPNQFQGSMPSFALNAEFQNTTGSRNSINLVNLPLQSQVLSSISGSCAMAASTDPFSLLRPITCQFSSALDSSVDFVRNSATVPSSISGFGSSVAPTHLSSLLRPITSSPGPSTLSSLASEVTLPCPCSTSTLETVTLQPSLLKLSPSVYTGTSFGPQPCPTEVEFAKPLQKSRPTRKLGDPDHSKRPRR